MYHIFMMDIEILREYYKTDNVFITNHAAERCRQRKIVSKDIQNAIMTGEIIEDYPDDFPFPSCLVCGKSTKDEIIHVCISDEGTSSKIITVYIPSLEKWEDDFKTRRRH